MFRLAAVALCPVAMRSFIAQRSLIAHRQALLTIATPRQEIPSLAVRWYSDSSTLTRADIERNVINIVASTAGVGPSEISLDTRLADELGVDSIQTLQTLAKLETNYDFEGDNTDIFEHVTVKDLVDYVAKKKNVN